MEAGATYVMPPTRRVVVAMCALLGARPASSSISRPGTLMYAGAMVLLFRFYNLFFCLFLWFLYIVSRAEKQKARVGTAESLFLNVVHLEAASIARVIKK